MFSQTLEPFIEEVHIPDPYSFVIPGGAQHGSNDRVCSIRSSPSLALHEVMVKLLHHMFTCLRIVNGRGFFPNWISQQNDYMGEAVKNLKPVPVEQMAVMKTVPFPS